MKNRTHIYLLIIFLFVSFLIIQPKTTNAATCPLQTVGLSSTKQSGKFSEVVALQMILLQYPDIYPGGTVVGNFGPNTEKAIKRIQTDNGLTSNGVLTSDTLSLLCDQYYQCPFQTMGLAKGSTDEPIEVKSLQYIFKYLPKVNYSGPITGTFGNLTEAALTKFQKAYNLYPTQLTDYDTNEKLCTIFETLNTLKLSSGVVAPIATKPKTTLSAICVSEPSSISPGTKTTFISQVAGGTPPYTYNWYGAADGSYKNSSVTLNSTGTYEAKLTVLDSKKTKVETSCKVTVNSQSSYEPPITIPLITPPSDNTQDVSIDITSDIFEITKNTDTANIVWTSSSAQTCYAASAPKNTNWNGQLDLKGQKTITDFNLNPGEAAIFTIICNNQNKTTVKYTVITMK